MPILFHERAWTEPASTIRSRAEAWALVEENLALVRWITQRLAARTVGRSGGSYYGYDTQGLHDELFPAACEAALRAAMIWDPSKNTFSTLTTAIVERGLFKELKRWRQTLDQDAVSWDHLADRRVAGDLDEYITGTVVAEAALALLSERERNVVERRLAGDTFVQLANTLDISKGQALYAWKDARKKLAAVLKEESE